jgi:RHS repeat-associated protein
LQAFTYGASNQRLLVQHGAANSNSRTYYAWSNGVTLAEYVETPAQANTPQWSQSNIYLGGRLLATLAPNGGSDAVTFHHPDRLGTRLTTNAGTMSVQEQNTLPYGNALDGESTGTTARRFTTYERSAMTGLDYAVNRTYDAQQGRFTQVDPIGMRAASSRQG